MQTLSVKTDRRTQLVDVTAQVQRAVSSTGVSSGINVFVYEGKLALGRWQGVFFCAYDGPRERKLLVKVVADSE